MTMGGFPTSGSNSGGTVTGVSGTAPVSVSSGNAPVVSLVPDGITAALLKTTGTPYTKFAQGRVGAGNISAPGVKTGDVITCATSLTAPGSANITGSFTALIATNDVIVQSSASDLSGASTLFTILPRGGGS